jgi:hypothetical protein
MKEPILNLLILCAMEARRKEAPAFREIAMGEQRLRLVVQDVRMTGVETEELIVSRKRLLEIPALAEARCEV